jgi:hypothetical protein
MHVKVNKSVLNIIAKKYRKPGQAPLYPLVQIATFEPLA